jgi:hypothetical protein
MRAEPLRVFDIPVTSTPRHVNVTFTDLFHKQERVAMQKKLPKIMKIVIDKVSVLIHIFRGRDYLPYDLQFGPALPAGIAIRQTRTSKSTSNNL